MSSRWLGGATLAVLALALPASSLAGCGGADETATKGSAATTTASAAPSAACDTCHMSDFRGAPGHVGERPTQCTVCHARDAWHPTGLHHDFWPLTGKHEKTRCFDCHTGTPAVFHGTDKACIACHRREYDGAPGHPGRFPTTCQECHSTTAWKPLLPEHAEPPGSAPPPSPPATAEASATASGTKPAPHPPKPSPRPAPSKATPSVEPTSHASPIWHR